MEPESGARTSAFGGGASFDGGRVYATNGAGAVAAIDAETGSEIWKVQPAGPLRGSPTIAFNSVYVMTQNNQIHALDAATGEPRWNESGSQTQAGVFGVAAPAAGQGTGARSSSTPSPRTARGSGCACGPWHARPGGICCTGCR